MGFLATRRQESLGTDPYPLRTSSHSPKKFRKSCRKVVEEFTTDSTKNLHTSWQRLPNSTESSHNSTKVSPRCFWKLFGKGLASCWRLSDYPALLPQRISPQEFRSQWQVLKKAILFATSFWNTSRYFFPRMPKESRSRLNQSRPN